MKINEPYPNLKKTRKLIVICKEKMKKKDFLIDIQNLNEKVIRIDKI